MTKHEGTAIPRTGEVWPMPETLRSNWYWRPMYPPCNPHNHGPVIIPDIKHFERPLRRLPEGAVGFEVLQRVEQDYIDQNGIRQTMHNITRQGRRFVGAELISQAELIGYGDSAADAVATSMQRNGADFIIVDSTGHLWEFDPENDVLLERSGD